MIYDGFNAFIENLINKVYQYQRERFSKLYGKTIHDLASSYIRFGGWEISYKGRGRTRLSFEQTGNVEFYTKTIYLNINYTYRLAGLPTPLIFDFHHLFYTISHEISHCLLSDFNPKWVESHDKDHIDLTQEIEDYLWTLPEVKELEKIQKEIDAMPRFWPTKKLK